jgi:hypothetical protein
MKRQTDSQEKQGERSIDLDRPVDFRVDALRNPEDLINRNEAREQRSLKHSHLDE